MCTHLDRITVFRLPDAIAEECLRIDSTYVDEGASLMQPSADTFAGEAKP
jgi:hypothetical protein